ncbi:hypothetical protein FSOLCH5_001915 [Fusarium solani]
MTTTNSCRSSNSNNSNNLTTTINPQSPALQHLRIPRPNRHPSTPHNHHQRAQLCNVPNR